jgi:TolB-like protein
MARDKLLALFWPDAPGDRAAHRLNQLAHSVRRRLGAEDLIAGTGELRLNPERITCDLWEFAAARREGALERAVELHAGPLLDGLFLPDNPEVERWLDGRRSALEREYHETLEALAVQAELRGDVRAAAEWWRRLAEREPLSSRVTMHLMTALAASGDRARALERARAYQEQVRKELDAEPNPAVLALAAQLRSPLAGSVIVGVLPIQPLDEGPEARGFALGLTEELTSAAGRLPGVRVAARTTLAAAWRDTADIRGVAAGLGLGFLVEGSTRTDGTRVRLVVRLVDGRDGCQIWSGRFEREVREAFQGQEALAGEVVEALRRELRLSPSPRGH